MAELNPKIKDAGDERDSWYQHFKVGKQTERLTKKKCKKHLRHSFEIPQFPKITEWLSSGIHYVLLITLWNLCWTHVQVMKNKTANKICETKECSQTENNKTCLHLLSIYDMLGRLWTRHFNWFHFHCALWHTYSTNIYQVLAMHQPLCLEQDRQDTCLHKACI